MDTGFYKAYKKYDNASRAIFENIRPRDVARAISSRRLSTKDLVALLSTDAEPHLEEMARKARDITLRNFGKAVQLYTPLYVSNYCSNECVYCGFNSSGDVERKTLSLDEVREEAEFIASTGLKHVLLLTGGCRVEASVSYLKDCVKVLKEYFSSVSIEIYALEEDEYTALIDEGVDGLTIYQETYDEEVYGKVHLSGRKRDFRFRLDAPERAGIRGMRTINLGVLLGLAHWRRDVFMLALHAEYMQDKFPSAEISVSVPRIKPNAEGFAPKYAVTDANVVQMVLALRLFLPRLGVTLSTREDADFRENMLPLGITRMSAGSTTAVGGHTAADSNAAQFEISDKRDVREIMDMLSSKGYQPVLKDWVG
ncbi:MAG: 2-iminoacetate synthase ThiH [Candidatus Tantalella remota]|nr:2-iminoacetate synthase ThiH [Candidatus Tantalella remota]